MREFYICSNCGSKDIDILKMDSEKVLIECICGFKEEKIFPGGYSGVCDFCGGEGGFVEQDMFISRTYTCPFCDGSGLSDWISDITIRRKDENFNNRGRRVHWF